MSLTLCFLSDSHSKGQSHKTNDMLYESGSHRERGPYFLFCEIPIEPGLWGRCPGGWSSCSLQIESPVTSKHGSPRSPPRCSNTLRVFPSEQNATSPFYFQVKPLSKNVFCVFWKSTEEGGHWSRDGCFLIQVNKSHTMCKCTHLSTFAVLVAFTSQVC